MGELWNKWMNCGCKLIVKKPFLALIIKAKASILILPKFRLKRCFFCHLMILIQLIGQPQTNLQDYGFVRISTTHLFSNWQSKKQFRNLPIGILQSSCLKTIQTMKKSVCWDYVFTQKGHNVDILPYSQLCCFPYWFAEQHNCVVSFLAPSQRYSMVEEEEACQLWPEKNWLLSGERKRRCCSCTKKEIMRLKNDSKLALNRQVKKGVHRVESYTIPYMVSRCQRWCLEKIQHSVPELTYRMSVELDPSLDPARMI